MKKKIYYCGNCGLCYIEPQYNEKGRFCVNCKTPLDRFIEIEGAE